jgi:hypothetical protein
VRSGKPAAQQQPPLDSEFYFLICQMLGAPFVIVFRAAELTW